VRLAARRRVAAAGGVGVPLHLVHGSASGSQLNGPRTYGRRCAEV
jgi:hypothetical protein